MPAGAEVRLRQVAETPPGGVLAEMHATEPKKAMASVPTALIADLTSADAILLGSPMRDGLIIVQTRAFVDATGGLSRTNALIGKVGGTFTATAGHHGGQEMTLYTCRPFPSHGHARRRRAVLVG